jgi:CRISPR-associated protein Cas5h
MDVSNKILVFEISSDYGHFRKYFTTSSPISYSFPSRTTIMGIIAGMLGKERDSYYEELSEEHLNIAIEIINPIKKVKFSTNYLHTKINEGMTSDFLIKKRTQIPCQYVKKPKYRIYLNSKNNELYNEIRERLESSNFHYSISLGQAQHLAKIKYLGEFDLKKENVTDNLITINSVLRKDCLNELKFEYSDGKVAEYLIDRLLVDFDTNFSRKPKLYMDYIYEKNGENSLGIICKLKVHFFRVNLDKDSIKNIVFL